MKMNRTVRDFQNALETLLQTKPFDKLTVDQICSEALLHRSSFYRYFHDKYDLLEQLINTRFNTLNEKATSEDDFIESAINYVDKNRDVFRHLSTDGTSNGLYTELIKISSEIIFEQKDNPNVNNTIAKALRRSSNPEMLSYMLGGSIIGACYWWQMHNYDVPTQEVIDFAKQSVLDLSGMSAN